MSPAMGTQRVSPLRTSRSWTSARRSCRTRSVDIGTQAWTASRYRSLGWHVEYCDGDMWLVCGRGLVGVAVPERSAGGVTHALHDLGVEGPVIGVRGEARYWVFLADPNGLVISRRDLPAGVLVLGCPARIPLPASNAASNRARWMIPPHTHRRWLPTSAAVLCAISVCQNLPGFAGPVPGETTRPGRDPLAGHGTRHRHS